MDAIVRPLGLLLASVLIATPGRSQPDPAIDLAQTIAAADNLTNLASAVQTAGLAELLSSEGPFTIFAPTDEAFAALPEVFLAKLVQKVNRERLTEVLTYHVIPGRVPASDIVKLDGAVTLNGQRLDLSRMGSQLMVDGATVIVTDKIASNGIIHVIDHVVQPSYSSIVEVATIAKQFKTLLAAIRAADLSSLMSRDSSYTLLAPTDEAFAALPAGTIDELLRPENKATLQQLVKHHVVAGRLYSEDLMRRKTVETLAGAVQISKTDGLKADDARLVTTDLDARNGVIHAIDKVLVDRK